MAPPNLISPVTALLPTVGTYYNHTYTKPFDTAPTRSFESEHLYSNSEQDPMPHYKYRSNNSPSTRLISLVQEPSTDLRPIQCRQAYTSMASAYQVFLQIHTNSQHRPNIIRPSESYQAWLCLATSRPSHTHTLTCHCPIHILPMDHSEQTPTPYRPSASRPKPTSNRSANLSWRPKRT